MRNAAILIVRLRGTATEAVKNIVLAGVGRLVVWDPAAVAPADLAAGFFFREDDVGKKVRVLDSVRRATRENAPRRVGSLGRSWALSRQTGCAGGRDGGWDERWTA